MFNPLLFEMYKTELLQSKALLSLLPMTGAVIQIRHTHFTCGYKHTCFVRACESLHCEMHCVYLALWTCKVLPVHSSKFI